MACISFCDNGSILSCYAKFFMAVLTWSFPVGSQHYTSTGAPTGASSATLVCLTSSLRGERKMTGSGSQNLGLHFSHSYLIFKVSLIQLNTFKSPKEINCGEFRAYEPF